MSTRRRKSPNSNTQIVLNGNTQVNLTTYKALLVIRAYLLMTHLAILQLLLITTTNHLKQQPLTVL